MAVIAGTLSSTANSVCVQPSPRRMVRICFAGIGLTGGGSFIVRSRAGCRPAAKPSTRATSAPASKVISAFFVFVLSVVVGFDGFDCRPQPGKFRAARKQKQDDEGSATHEPVIRLLHLSLRVFFDEVSA